MHGYLGRRRVRTNQKREARSEAAHPLSCSFLLANSHLAPQVRLTRASAIRELSGMGLSARILFQGSEETVGKKRAPTVAPPWVERDARRLLVPRRRGCSEVDLKGSG